MLFIKIYILINEIDPHIKPTHCRPVRSSSSFHAIDHMPTKILLRFTLGGKFCEPGLCALLSCRLQNRKIQKLESLRFLHQTLPRVNHTLSTQVCWVATIRSEYRSTYWQSISTFQCISRDTEGIVLLWDRVMELELEETWGAWSR